MVRKVNSKYNELVEQEKRGLPVLLIGRSVELHSVASLSLTLRMTQQSAFSFLRKLHVPLVAIGKNSFFHISSLERALFYAARFGGPGFVAPGSYAKSTGKWKNKPGYQGPSRLTLEDIKKAQSEEVERERRYVARHRARNVREAARSLARVFSRIGAVDVDDQEDQAFDGRAGRELGGVEAATREVAE